MVVVCLTAVVLPATTQAQNVDLIALEVHARDARRSGMVEAAAGGPAWVYFKVENLGAGTVPKGTEFKRIIYESGQPAIVQGSKRITRALKGYGKRTVRVPLRGTGNAGTRKLRCTIDPRKELAEKNENNNVIQRNLVLKVFRSNAYRVELRDFQPFARGVSYGRPAFYAFLRFNAFNPGATVPKRQFGKNRPLWQADCQFNGYPTEGFVMNTPLEGAVESSQVYEYPFGEIPATGTSSEVESRVFIFDGVGPSGFELPPELSLNCTLRVGAFTRRPTQQRLYRGILETSVAWDPVQIWWQIKASYKVINPYGVAEAPKPQLDIWLSSVTASASQSSSEVPDHRRNTWIRFTLRADKGTSPVTVQCSVLRDNSVVKSGSTSKAISPTGPGSTTMEGEAAINMGQLAAGQYTASCVADPAQVFQKDTARANNP